MLKQGMTMPRPAPGTSQAHPGVSPLHPIAQRNTSFQPLPPPLGLPPYHYSLEQNFPEIAKAISDAGKMVLHVIGDSGGVQDGEYQSFVVEQMENDVNAGGVDVPRFCYHVGDVVYYTGAHDDDYYAQFYEPYAHYALPIFSIPGNHDGEVDDPSVNAFSLDGWVAYFMQALPDVDPISRDAPRVGLSLPNPYWTLETPFATFIGLYTNVPEGGSIDSVQQQWVTNEFATAPDDRALIVALHHPVYSFDVYHSGSARMADVIENSIRDTGRVPNLVLSGHVHNYQRIEQTIHPDGPTPFLVVGNGGYHNLHKIHSNNGDVDQNTGAKLIYGVQDRWGHLKLTVTKESISGRTIEVARDSTVNAGDTFDAYPAGPIRLADPRSVPML
jgi:hypothetical protein